MIKREYAAGWGHNGPFETMTIEAKSIGSIEHARSVLAEVISENACADWLINPRLVKRDGPNHPWEDLADPASDLIRSTLSDIAADFRRLGAGVVQGNDVHAILMKAVRELGGSAHPEEFDS